MVVYDETWCAPPTRAISTRSARVAWLCHMIDADGLVSLDPSYATMPPPSRESLLAHWVSRAAPVLMSRVAVRSTQGATVEFHPILLPFTSRWAKQSLDARALETARALVQQGIDTAADLGCSLVSLGQYTSILTANGTRLDPRGLGITTGNSYAIALALQAIERACVEAGIEPQSSTAVIVGASGNIGRACAHLLARRFSRLILVGSAKRGALLRLQSIAKTLPNVAISTDLDACRRGAVVLAAVNAAEAPLLDHHLAPGAIVCDLSVPSVLHAQTVARRPDVTVIKGGIAALPFAEDLRITGFPLPAGQAYGCMAEAMLLGFEGVRTCEFTGSLTPAHVARTGQWAVDHGFHLAAFKHTCVFASDRHDSAPAIAC
jgi:fatty aldehyde-generating acyl-ACP reductase